MRGITTKRRKKKKKRKNGRWNKLGNHQNVILLARFLFYFPQNLDAQIIQDKYNLTSVYLRFTQQAAKDTTIQVLWRVTLCRWIKQFPDFVLKTKALRTFEPLGTCWPIDTVWRPVWRDCITTPLRQPQTPQQGCRFRQSLSLLASRQQSVCLSDRCLLLYVGSWTPDDGREDRPKHVECHSKVKWSWYIDVI